MASEKTKKPFYKKWWVWLLGIIIIAAIASGGGEDTEQASTEPKETKTDQSKKEEPKKKETKQEKPKEETKKEQTTVGMNQPLKVGDVTFTVTGKSTAAQVGGEFGQKAQGTYLILDVVVKNEGKKAITTDSSFFKLKAGDVEYEADAVADAYINENGTSFFLQQVNPGIENKGKIAFDVPADIANKPDLILNVQTGFYGAEQGQISLK
ncbi:DUF4352 domain-containing protein [Bacillus methanolicus]|uniref:DUF4352 domain-containing protein n=1 Tax=Bacillus methanolicus TaxID=1471 RepID=UPI002380603A|nr:DUF4352 domain-containing protein [Bacillus methanolicus]MDE3837894.1 DUF4352 domain-containing protein [Bacillus methanolicus]